MHRYSAREAEGFDGPALERELEAAFGEPFSELAYARHVAKWQEDETADAQHLDAALRYAAWAAHTEAGKARHRSGVLFKTPGKLDPQRLVPVVTDESGGYRSHRLERHHLRRRDGFKLTDAGADLVHALDEANYCIWCHEQGKDSCSKGLKEKPPTEGFRKTVFGVPLAGCPLEEKISEFHMVKARGEPLAALGIIAVDNPMVAGTGHRICNDCMKSCIYQKQDPVDIPQAETRSLKAVLGQPWGFEMYGLLTRWNPLNNHSPVAKPASGRRVLVVGLGPAGYTLSHYLLNDGHTVVAIDGLKIEPLDATLSGVKPDGTRVPFKPIKHLSELQEDLNDRVMAGFGGVAEYGITVRWDKNFLKIIRLLLERRSTFAMFGGVRFGGTITAEQAFEMGFDHVALALGAGKPTLLSMPGGLARGVRMASDFLMALQLTGAAKPDSIANLQLRLPAVVIGGGLTAIDTATEAMAYYPVQVEKFLKRYETLVAEHGVHKGRIRLTLASGERHAGLTVNEYETLLMQNDLVDVLRNPLHFAARQGLDALSNPRAVPAKAWNYAKYDFIQVVNELIDLLGLSETIVERLVARTAAIPASRMLRMKRSASFLVSPDESGDSGRIVRGKYQTPILFQWQGTSRQARAGISPPTSGCAAWAIVEAGAAPAHVGLFGVVECGVGMRLRAHHFVGHAADGQRPAVRLCLFAPCDAMARLATIKQRCANDCDHAHAHQGEGTHSSCMHSSRAGEPSPPAFLVAIRSHENQRER